MRENGKTESDEIAIDVACNARTADIEIRIFRLETTLRASTRLSRQSRLS